MTYFDKSDEIQRLLTEFYALQRPIEDYLASQYKLGLQPSYIKISQPFHDKLTAVYEKLHGVPKYSTVTKYATYYGY